MEVEVEESYSACLARDGASHSAALRFSLV
jgi:hypothetical protein